jgi:3-phosphoinositide dependent protein kinase-1
VFTLLEGTKMTDSSSNGGPKPKKTVDDFEFGEVIGEGSYGEVKLATEKDTGAVFAAKILVKKHIVKEKKIKYVNTEKAILDILRHPAIVQLYCTFQDKENLYYVLELCRGGDLLFHLNKTGAFDEASARFYAAEVLSAILYAHSKRVAHRDIKPENVLLSSSMHAKLSDFGCAKQFNDVRERSKSFCGTPEYVCPELLNDDRSAGIEADMWSFGVLLFQLLSGKLPFRGITEYHTMLAVAAGDYTVPSWISSDATDLIKKLLVREPNLRLTAAEAKNHPFFVGVNWEVLHAQPPPQITCSPLYSPQHSPPVAANTSPNKSPDESPPDSPSETEEISEDGTSERHSSPTVSPSSSPSWSSRNILATPPKMRENFLVVPESLSRVTSDYTASKWPFINEGEIVLNTCSMQKRSKFLTRKRVLIITNKRLIIANPRTLKVKCSVGWDDNNINVSSKAKTFVLTTAARTFSLLAGGSAQKWVETIEHHKRKQKGQDKV